MIIITKKGAYRWNYKRFLTHMFYVLGIIYFIVAYCIVSNMDYNTMLGR